MLIGHIKSRASISYQLTAGSCELGARRSLFVGLSSFLALAVAVDSGQLPSSTYKSP